MSYQAAQGPRGARYLVLSELGQGGMGGVYRVLDRGSGQHFALKRLRARTASGSSGKLLALFEREYHVLANLAHPRIIAVHDYGIDSLGPFYTMELLSGTSLHARGRLPWRELCVLLRDVASALALVHSRRFAHRDVTPRNIQCMADGRAKLIDFGAMTTMGGASAVVGTPPFVPPEALLPRHSLDGRADLFALGATAYWALTGRHAYPARHVSELEASWQIKPEPPTTFDDSIPAGLDELIMSLLSLDVSGRPGSAAEVMERLAAIASLAPDELSSVSAAYLTTPNMVGRKRALRTARQRALQALRGSGGLLRISGAAGVGRSRFLDACMLESKLLGMTVARVQAEAGQSADALAAALGKALRIAAPDIAPEEVWNGPPPSAAGPAVLPQALVTLSDAAPLLLAIDDAQLLSAAALDWSSRLSAAIADRRILLLATVSHRRTRTDNAAALNTFTKLGGQGLELASLDVGESRALLASVFGEGPSLEPLLKRLYSITQGSPRALMDVARRLVDDRVLRYEAGSWLFPERFDVAGVAITLLDAPLQKLAALSEPARMLAFATARSTNTKLSPDELGTVCGGSTRAQLTAASEELLQAHVFAAHPDGRHAFSSEAWAQLLTRECPAALARRLHARLAEVLEARPQEQAQCASHWLASGEDERAFQLVIALCTSSISQDSSLQDYLALPAGYVELLGRCVEYCERVGRPLRERYIVESVFVRADARRHHATSHAIARVLQRLRLDSGLDDYDALPDTLDPTERLQRAFTQATLRHEAAPPHERVFAPVEAIGVLARCALALCTSSVAALDHATLQSLPLLEPFAILSPSLEIVNEAVLATRAVVAGRYLRARTHYQRMLQRIDQPDRAGLSGVIHHYTRLGVIHGLGYIEGSLGVATALDWADVLRDDPRLQVNALHIRETYYFVQGRADDASACRKRAELLQISERGDQHYEGATLVMEIFACGQANDLLGIKRCMDRVQPFAELYPGWRKVLACAVAEYERIRGDHEAALRAAAEVLDVDHTLDHGVWVLAMGTRLRTLLALGQHQDVLRIGREASRVARRDQMTSSPLDMAVATAEAKLGEYGAAIARVDAHIEQLRGMGATGLLLGSAYETRARIAVLAGDVTAFEHYAQRCAEQYSRGHNAALRARYQRLMFEAEQARMLVSRSLSTATDVAYAGVQQIALELEQHTTLAARARCMLVHVLERAAVSDAFFYVLQDGTPQLVRGRGQAPAWLADRVQTHLASSPDDSATLLADDSEVTQSGLASEALHTAEADYRVLPLVRSDAPRDLLGAIVLCAPSARGVVAVQEIAALVSSALQPDHALRDRRSAS